MNYNFKRTISNTIRNSNPSYSSSSYCSKQDNFNAYSSNKVNQNYNSHNNYASSSIRTESAFPRKSWTPNTNIRSIGLNSKMQQTSKPGFLGPPNLTPKVNKPVNLGNFAKRKLNNEPEYVGINSRQNIKNNNSHTPAYMPAHNIPLITYKEDPKQNNKFHHDMKKEKIVANFASSQQNKRDEDIINLFILTVSIFDIKNIYKLNNSEPKLFEIFGIINSQVKKNPSNSSIEFFLKDKQDQITCLFYNVDNLEDINLERNIHCRCICKYIAGGVAKPLNRYIHNEAVPYSFKSEDRLLLLHCISVRESTDSEKTYVESLIEKSEQNFQKFKISQNEQ